MIVGLVYNPANWYWNVANGGPAGQVFSSVVGNFVAATDTNYEAWLQSGGQPTNIDTLSDLLTTLAEQNPGGTPYGKFVVAGLTVASTSFSTIVGTYAIDQASQDQIETETNFIDKYAIFTNGATTNLIYPMMNGNEASFPTTDAFVAFAKQVGLTVAAAKNAAATGAAMPSNQITV